MSSNFETAKNQNKFAGINFLLAGLAAVTLYFNTKANDPFNSPKLLILLVMAGWLLGFILDSYRKRPIKRFSQEFFIVGIALFFLAAQLFLLLGRDLIVFELLGDTQRRNGFLAYLTLVIIFLYTIRNFNYDSSAQLLSLINVIGLLLVVYGMLQVNGRDWVKWSNPHNSMIGTLGNPNFASSLLAIIALCAGFSLIHSRVKQVYRILAPLVIILSLFLIYRSNSRQGFVVVGVGILVFVSIWSLIRGGRIRFIVPLIALSITILSILGMLQKGPLAYFLYKDSVSVRGFYWKAAINMFKSDPITGVGLDNYGYYFKLFRDPEYALRYGYELTSSNAHNTFLQLFATGGLFVGTSYFILMLSILFIGIRNIRKLVGKEQLWSAGLLSIWLAFQSQALISIDNIGLSIWGWIFGGAIVGIRSNEMIKSTSKSVSQPKHINLNQILLSGVFLIPTIIISMLIHRQEADLFVAKAAVMQQPANKELASLNAKKVLNARFLDPYYKFEALLILNTLGETEFSENQVKLLLKEYPGNLIYLTWLGNKEFTKGNYFAALDYALQIEKYDPWNANNLVAVGELYKLLKMQNEMENYRVKINKIAPNTETSKYANQVLR
jgi:O-antigen ligase